MCSSQQYQLRLTQFQCGLFIIEIDSGVARAQWEREHSSDIAAERVQCAGDTTHQPDQRPRSSQLSGASHLHSLISSYHVSNFSYIRRIVTMRGHCKPGHCIINPERSTLSLQVWGSFQPNPLDNKFYCR